MKYRYDEDSGGTCTLLVFNRKTSPSPALETVIGHDDHVDPPNIQVQDHLRQEAKVSVTG